MLQAWACRFPGLQQPQPQQTVDGLSHISLEYSEGDLAAATEYFSAARKLGSGTYGAVYRGLQSDQTLTCFATSTHDETSRPVLVVLGL
eukprot:3624117-Amphidinium_carterae.1